MLLSRMSTPQKSWNQIEEYIWKWYPILFGIASLEEENKKFFIT